MPFTCRRPNASKEPREQDTSEAAGSAAPAANLPETRLSGLNPDAQGAGEGGKPERPWSGQKVATTAQKSESAALGSLAMRHAAHGTRAVIGALRGTPR